MAVLCTLILASQGAAHANGRRQVAVIALADDPRVEAFANAIGTTLVNHTTLGPLEQGALIGALVGELLDENRDPIASAMVTRARAEKALSDFVFPAAIATAQAGHESLQIAIPTTEVVRLYSDLALVIAKAKLGEDRPADAASFFELVYQLTPARQLDPALELPEVVQAYHAARSRRGRPGTLVVKGSGNVWIDGKDHGAYTKPISLSSGLHVVWLTGPARETRAKQVYVEADKENVLEIGESPASTRLKIQRARVELSKAANPAARALAMRHLAELLGVHDAAVISMSAAPTNKLIFQTWHDKAEGALPPGFSAHRLAEGERPLDLLSPLAPPLVEAPPPPLPIAPRLAARAWYERRSIQASVALGVVAVVLGSWMIARSLDDGFVNVDPNISNESVGRFTW